MRPRPARRRDATAFPTDELVSTVVSHTGTATRCWWCRRTGEVDEALATALGDERDPNGRRALDLLRRISRVRGGRWPPLGLFFQMPMYVDARSPPRAVVFAAGRPVARDPHADEGAVPRRSRRDRAAHPESGGGASRPRPSRSRGGRRGNRGRRAGRAASTTAATDVGRFAQGSGTLTAGYPNKTEAPGQLRRRGFVFPGSVRALRSPGLLARSRGNVLVHGAATAPRRPHSPEGRSPRRRRLGRW